MPVPTTIDQLSTTAASNFPQGTDSPASLDDVQRAHGSFIATLRNTLGMTSGTLVPATARTNLGAAASGANSDITSLSALTSINGGPIAGLRNRIINGGFDVWQRASAGTAITSAPTYVTADRWAFQSGATVATCGRTANPIALATGRYAVYMQRTAANTGTAGVFATHIMETANCVNLQGQTVTLSFWAKAGTTFSAASSQMKIFLGTGTGSDEGLSSYNANTWTGQVFQTNGALQPITTTATKYFFTATIPSNATEIGLQIGFIPVGTAGADDTLYIGGVQLEVGSTATTFEQRPYGMELALCQRYLPAIPANLTFFTGLAASGTTAYVPIQFPVMARTPPSGVITGTLSSMSVSDGGFTGKAVTGLSISSAGSYNAVLQLTVASGLTAGQAAVFATAGQTLYFTGCEL